MQLSADKWQNQDLNPGPSDSKKPHLKGTHLLTKGKNSETVTVQSDKGSDRGKWKVRRSPKVHPGPVWGYQEQLLNTPKEGGIYIGTYFQMIL